MAMSAAAFCTKQDRKGEKSLDKISRRGALSVGIIAGGLFRLPTWVPRMAFASPLQGFTGDTLIVVFLRGAADGLNLVIPHTDDEYYRLRPTIGIPRPDDLSHPLEERVMDLDGAFGFHPSLRALKEIWEQDELSIIHACGGPDESRSHFQAMELMERGVSEYTGPASGWIGRHLATHGATYPSPLRAVSIGEAVPRSLYGSIPASALRSITDFHFGGDTELFQRIPLILGQLYVGDDSLDQIGQETLEILDALEKITVGAGTHPYPESEFGQGLQQIAALIRAEVGLEVAAIDHGGWDTHFTQGGSQGLMSELIHDLAAGLAALYTDLRDVHRRMTIIVMSEFGRRLKENASLGTDHGHGGVMLILGGNTQGGVYANWPGLAPEDLVGPGDLAVTIDYRSILAELCVRRLNNPAIEAIFPDFEPRFIDCFT
jgi:uncharacterized protein (DUF1501 family)